MSKPTGLDRFVDVRGPDECWPWTGERSAKGYGIIYVKSEYRRKAHRAAYERAHGPIPEGFMVLHRCDNPPCCNPAHLWLGTRADNMRDMHAKGRRRNVVLTPDDVREIRFLRRRGVSWADLAETYEVSLATIEDVVCHLKWKHVS